MISICKADNIGSSRISTCKFDNTIIRIRTTQVAEAIKKQVDKFIHYTPAYMYHEPLVKLSKKLCDIAPGDYEKLKPNVTRFS
jgi:hypothetical protein